ncbi:MAG: nucleoside monophosphate kinase [Verrucomicrobiota bacterium]
MHDTSSENPPDERYKTILVFGAPGSGKGTQGKALGMIPRFYHCACGDVFRALDTRTPIGQEFVKYSAAGKLVPDEITVKLWHTQITSKEDSHDFKPDIDFLVLDGIPRNVEQAELIDPYIEVVQVFHLSCPNREELARRLRKRALKDNRLDDANEEVIKERITTYEQESKPILQYYGGKVTDIDASQPPAKVLYDVLDVIVHLEEWTANASIA